MPNIWTHNLFIDQLCENLDRMDIVKTAGNTLHMGAQGPDPFFYHNFWPFTSNQKVEEVGMKLHTEQCGPVLMEMVKRGATQKSRVQAYILGFLSHHILDRRTHPYIHYHAGYELNNHQVLEVLIDTIMLEQYRNIKTWKKPVYEQIKMGASLAPIASFMQSVLEKHFPDLEDAYPSDFIEKSYKDIQLAQRVLYDPWGWKNKWFGTLVSSFSHQPVSDDKDYLNKSRRIWNHPATNEEQSESFIDLYEEALVEGTQLLRLTLAYWQDSAPSKLEEIDRLIDNISYDTGKPLSQNLKNQWSQPIV